MWLDSSHAIVVRSKGGGKSYRVHIPSQVMERWGRPERLARLATLNSVSFYPVPEVRIERDPALVEAIAREAENCTTTVTIDGPGAEYLVAGLIAAVRPLYVFYDGERIVVASDDPPYSFQFSTGPRPLAVLRFTLGILFGGEAAQAIMREVKGRGTRLVAYSDGRVVLG